MTTPVTLVVMPAWETWLLRALVAASTASVASGAVLAAGAADRNDPVLLPAGVCIVVGAAAFAGLLVGALRWVATITVDETCVRVTRVLLPARTLARGDAARGVLAIVPRPTLTGPRHEPRLILLDAAGRVRVRATWTERQGRTSAALATISAADVPVDVLPASVPASELERRHPGATSIVERNPRSVGLVVLALAVVAVATALAL